MSRGCPRRWRRCRIDSRKSWSAPKPPSAPLTEIVSKVPESLDRSNRFFTNVERIFQESELPALSADSRKFFSTTSAQIDKIATDLDRVIGADGTLVTFVETGERRDQGRRPPRHEPVSACSGGPDHAGGRRSSAHAAGHSRFARSAARSRPATAGAAGVDRLWSATSGSEAMTRVMRRTSLIFVVLALPGGRRVPAETARDDTGPHDRAATARAAGSRRLPRRARTERPRPRSGCSIRKRVDTLAAGCFTNNLMAS